MTWYHVFGLALGAALLGLAAWCQATGSHNTKGR